MGAMAVPTSPPGWLASASCAPLDAEEARACAQGGRQEPASEDEGDLPKFPENRENNREFLKFPAKSVLSARDLRPFML